MLGRYLRNDGPLLLGSLLLAVLVWKYADEELTDTRTLDARLELRVPEGLTVVAGMVRSVEVSLRGPRGLMAALDPSGVTARYELPPESEGTVPVTLTEAHLSLPENVKVAALPRPFSIVVERLMQGYVKVQVRTVGEPAPGYAVLDSPRAEPAEVLVRGRKEKFETLTQIPTEEIRLTDRREWRPTYYQLAPGEGLYCSERVLVFMRIGVAPVPRDLPSIEVMLLMPQGFDRQVELETSTIGLRLYGEPKLVTGLEARSVLAMVDVAELAKLKAGVYELQVSVQLPAGVSLAPGVRPPKVTVRLK